MLELDEMNNPADISTPDELERALRAYLRAESPVDRRLKCPESLLYIEPVKTLLRMNPRGHRPWFSYDRDQGVLKLLAMSRPLHDAATMLASTFMTSAAVARFIPSQFERKITLSIKGYLMARTCEPQAGSSKVQAWTKYPDLSIVFRADDQPLPVVIFETGFTERYADLANDAAQWLLRSGGKVRLVVLIDIREDSNSRLLLKKDPAARGRLRHLVRSFGSDFARAKHDIHDPSDDASDTSDPEIYDSIRASIVVSDWVGEISAEMELWELRDGVPVIRERTVGLCSTISTYILMILGCPSAP
ncbi:hypothetical protein BJX61DRAFT_460647 [Aspergillus egyptiacus]|nr:hypothetical protein BJX61DRAFT_460647 [Aspergillus egyptiacus]